MTGHSRQFWRGPKKLKVGHQLRTIKPPTINLINNLTNEALKAKVVFIHHYLTVREMLEKEGPERVISSELKTIEHGIEIYNALDGYEEGIKKNGIYAIGLELV